MVNFNFLFFLLANVCSPNPCQNNGACIAISSTAAFGQCTNGYSGYQCQYANPCNSNPGQNQGTCVSRPKYSSPPDFSCNCLSGFSGSLCQVNLNAQCVAGFCSNGGTCSLINGIPTCQCIPYYTGSRCESINNPCIASSGLSVCKNGGICSTNYATYPYYSCQCPVGYSGINCEVYQPVTIPTTQPTVTSSVCSDTDPIKCATYAANKLCNNLFVINGISIPNYCKLSCGVCTVSASPCVDVQSNCVVWALFNLCDKLNGIIPHPCRKSCKIC